jgi:PhzF family phenazine biosynthesis protein
MTGTLPTRRRFMQLDVFTATPLRGNPLAVVVEAEGLTDAQMAAFARWTNLSETTFLLPPTDPDADYRVRIYTPARELPFAGHPTLGSCHAWLAAGGVPRHAGEIVQQCGVGLVRVRRQTGDVGQRLAFAAPPLIRSGPVEAPVLAQIERALRIDRATIVASRWVDNGPGWVAVMLRTREELLALQPDFVAMAGLELGVLAPWPGGDAQFEVRGFVPTLGVPEDPVTGSLNAGLAQWLIGAGMAPSHYVASQGTALGREGRVYVDHDGEQVWIGGHVAACIDGTLTL